MTYALLTDPAALDLVSSLTFWDSKRPINKKLLQRIDLAAIAQKAAMGELATRAELAASRLGITWFDWRDTLARLLAGWADHEVRDDRRLFG